MVKKNMKEEKKEAILPLWFRILGTIYIIFMVWITQQLDLEMGSIALRGIMVFMADIFYSFLSLY